MKKYHSILSEIFQFLEVKFSIYLNRRVFVMDQFRTSDKIILQQQSVKTRIPRMGCVACF